MARAAFAATEGYDERLFFFGEELDLCWQLIAAGYEIRYVPDIAVLHKSSLEQRLDWASGRFYYNVRNMIYLNRKYRPARGLAAGYAAGYLLKSQAKLAHEQALIAAKQAALVAEEAKLRAEMMAKRPDQHIDEATVGDIEARARDYEKQMQALETEMHRHEEHLRALEPEHARVAQQMGHRSQELETRMVQASRELKELLTKAIASGVALGVR